jgi:uncharacterized protein
MSRKHPSAPRVKAQASALDVKDGVIASFGDARVVYRKVALYVPPPGVLPKNRLAADSFPGANEGINFLNAQRCGLGFPGYAYLSELAQRSEYRSPSSITANEMTRKFIRFVSRSKDPKAAKKFKIMEAAFKRFDVRQILRSAVEKELFFGRAQIYIRIKGQDTPEGKMEPLVISPETIAKGSLLGFKVIEPIWTSPLTYNSNDATADDFYVPQAWYVLGQEISASRLITIVSNPVPDMLKPSYNFGGISLTQLMEPYVIRWLKTVDGVNRLINNFSVMILKSNLQAILQGKAVDGKGIINRAKLFTLTRDNQALTIIDKNSEEMDSVNVPLSGLSELQAQAQEHMAAPSKLPLVKLTGITPSGLNASSEGEITVLHEHIGSLQENFLEPPLDVIFDLVQLNEFGAIDEDLDYEFIELVETTRKEVADTRKANAELITGLIGSNVIDADEGREALRMDPDSGFGFLEGDAPEAPTDPNQIDPETGKPYEQPGGDDDDKPKPGDDDA